MTSMISPHTREILVSTLCGLAGIVLTAGTLLATPKHGATDSPRQPTLDCRVPSQGLEAPCRQLAEVNPPIV